MEYLTYPFHDPSLAIPPSSTLSKHHNDPAITDKVANDDNALERLRHDPLIWTRTTTDSSGDSSSGSDSSSYCSLPLAAEDPPLVADNDNEEDDQSHTTPSISNLSTTSSLQFIKHHNAAFEKLRTAGFKSTTGGGAGDSGYTAADIPDEWKNYIPPSLNKGHWRTFGPTEAVVTVVEGEALHAEHASTSTAGQYRNVKRKLEGAKSSLWKGTIWLTETHLIFILLKDAIPKRIDPSEMEASSSHTENWVSSIRRMLGHGHRRNSEDENDDTDDFPLTVDPETGFPITAFQIPLTSLLNVKLKKPHHKSHLGRSGSTKRNSVASSSTGGWLSPPGSTTISPALSRIQSRNARSLTRHESHLNPNHHHRPQSRDASPAGNFESVRGRVPAPLEATPPPTVEQQPLDFGALINNKEDPFIIVVYSENEKNAAKVEYRFESGLYVDEAKDLAGRLKEYVKKR